MRRRLIAVNFGIVVLVIVANTTDLSKYLDAALGLDWSKEFVAFLRKQSEGLVLLVAISLIVEFVAGSRDRKEGELVREYVEKSFQGQQSDFLVSLGIGLALGDSTAGREVSQRLSLSKPPLRGCVVHVSVSRTDSADGLLLVENQTEFDCDRDRAIYAFVRNSADMSSVVTHLNEVTEVQIVKDERSSFTTITETCSTPEGSPLLYIPATGPSQKLPMKPMARREATALARSAGIAPEAVLFLYAATPPGGRLRVSNRQEHDAAINFTWWMSDRLLEVDMLRIDLSGVAKSADSVEVVAFWISPGRDSNLVGTGVWEFRKLGWLTPGDGLIAHWKY